MQTHLSHNTIGTTNPFKAIDSAFKQSKTVARSVFALSGGQSPEMLAID